MTTQKQRDREAALAHLRNDLGLKPGDVVHTSLTHTSRSGMSRSIRVFVIRGSEPREITYHVSRVLDLRVDNVHGGVKVSGVGMDMGFHVVYGLSRSMFPKGHDCTGVVGCPSNDHANDYNQSMREAKERLGLSPFSHNGEIDDEDWRNVRDLAETIRSEELGHRPGRTHSDGGYALKQVWL